MSILDTLQKRKEEADKIVNDINLKSKTIEENIRQVNSLLKEIKTKDKEYIPLIDSLKNVHDSAVGALDKFKMEKKKIEGLLLQINHFYNKME